MCVCVRDRGKYTSNKYWVKLDCFKRAYLCVTHANGFPFWMSSPPSKTCTYLYSQKSHNLITTSQSQSLYLSLSLLSLGCALLHQNHHIIICFPSKSSYNHLKAKQTCIEIQFDSLNQFIILSSYHNRNIPHPPICDDGSLTILLEFGSSCCWVVHVVGAMACSRVSKSRVANVPYPLPREHAWKDRLGHWGLFGYWGGIELVQYIYLSLLSPSSFICVSFQFLPWSENFDWNLFNSMK